MAIKKIELEVDIPEGWEFDGYRVPMEGDHYLSGAGQVIKWAVGGPRNQTVIIKKVKVKQYREPVLPADYLKQVEFSDDGIVWMPGCLSGWRGANGNDFPWVNTDWVIYEHCRIEVEDE